MLRNLIVSEYDPETHKQILYHELFTYMNNKNPHGSHKTPHQITWTAQRLATLTFEKIAEHYDCLDSRLLS